LHLQAHLPRRIATYSKVGSIGLLMRDSHTRLVSPPLIA
jgi:hypothetical protein